MAMVTVMLGDQTLGSHTISHYPFVVGREAGSDIHIDNIGISRQHCHFLWADGTYKVADLGSSNGTQVNGEKVKEGNLKDGDEVRLGKYRLMFHQADGEPPPPPKGGLADMIKDAVDPNAAPAGGAAPDANMKTFQMSADAIRAQAGIAASASGQRAGDLAESMDDKKKGGGGGIKPMTIVLIGAGIVIVTLVVIVVLLLTGGTTPAQ